MDRKRHWEGIYERKRQTEVSWYQPVPEMSLDLIEKTGASKDAAIIDIGGGSSYLVDHLIQREYSAISVLDISGHAIERVKKRLEPDQVRDITWIEADIVDWTPDSTYQVWHDRAAFHFLTDDQDRRGYMDNLRAALEPGGHVILGTFSPDGPRKCSSLNVQQYDSHGLQEQLGDDFELVETCTVDHRTPFDTTQNFTFALFRRK